MSDNLQPQLSDLTPRQLQILKLLQEGKPNKALSEELGIGLGTVKQHLVALFKKLNVKNRAMAISLMADMQNVTEASHSLKSQVLLDRRPCVVLSIALPQDAPPDAVRVMHGSLAALAATNDAVFLARPGNAGDVIFGIQHASEYVVAIALRLARNVFHDLESRGHGVADSMMGCLTAGHAFASMQRFGGWTGEALASATIASARELLGSVPPGGFKMDVAASDLVVLAEMDGLPQGAVVIPFSSLANLHCSASRPKYELVGRQQEAARLAAALEDSRQGKGGLICLEGEMGMGKSRLCEEIAEQCSAEGGKLDFFRCMPPAWDYPCWDLKGRQTVSLEKVFNSLNSHVGSHPDLSIVDDAHLLSPEEQGWLYRAAKEGSHAGRLAIIAGRKLAHVAVDPEDRIVLRRMSPQSLQGLVRRAMGRDFVENRAGRVVDICSEAAGVPLFAVELARHMRESDRLPLTLQLAINARLDSLRLDRQLLRAVAKHSAGIALDALREQLGASGEEAAGYINRSVAAGVLLKGDNEWISFSHPLLRQAVNDTITD